MNFKTALVLIFGLCVLGCGRQTKADLPSSQSGSREFNINNGKPAIVVSLYGTDMGTPDTEAVWHVIQIAQDKGWITELVDLGPPIEGGVHHCLEIQDITARTQVLNELKNVGTSMELSHYLVTSVDKCNREQASAKDM